MIYLVVATCGTCGQEPVRWTQLKHHADCWRSKYLSTTLKLMKRKNLLFIRVLLSALDPHIFLLTRNPGHVLQLWGQIYQRSVLGKMGQIVIYPLKVLKLDYFHPLMNQIVPNMSCMIVTNLSCIIVTNWGKKITNFLKKKFCSGVTIIQLIIGVIRFTEGWKWYNLTNFWR